MAAIHACTRGLSTQKPISKSQSTQIHADPLKKKDKKKEKGEKKGKRRKKGEKKANFFFFIEKMTSFPKNLFLHSICVDFKKSHPRKTQNIWKFMAAISIIILLRDDA